MFIHWKKKNVHILGSHDGRDVLILQPGWNEGSDLIWKQYENDPEVKTFLEEGVLSLHEHPEAGKEVSRQGSGREVKEKGRSTGKVEIQQPRYLGEGDQEVHINQITDEKKALDIVRNTWNKKLLERWFDEETRSRVKKALDSQLKNLTNDVKSESGQ